VHFCCCIKNVCTQVSKNYKDGKKNIIRKIEHATSLEEE